ncbi:hypothetical protein [Psychroserpens damuponensis]|uniref:hypothetical protein n=1 Tax=Psychroserpens damuponensis TaxID=943936 RepID=UPI000590325A|nr:hypothetical protein [Psychroserpens damuponensis]
MKFKTLETSEYKNLYFHRTEDWDWLTSDMIRVIDSKSPRVITMDPWPQKIFLEALGQLTVEDYVHAVTKEYPKGNVPKELDDTILEMLVDLVYGDKIIAFSEVPITLDEALLNPMTQEGDIAVKGIWKGTYQYSIPDEFKDDRMIDVEFTINIDTLKGNTFTGTVKDDLSTGGTPGTGTIKGKFDNDRIYFTKNMPISATIDKNGIHSTHTNKKHPTLVYEGQFSRNKQIIKGTWKFKSKALYFKGFIPRLLSRGTGTFVMNKS